MLQEEAQERNQYLFEQKKEKKQEKGRERYKNLSEEEKKCQYHRDWNKNLYQEEKQKKVEYMANYYLAHKKWFLGFKKCSNI